MMRMLFIVCLIGTSTSLSRAESIQPGIWKAKTSFELNGLPLPASEDEECIQKNEAKDIKNTIARELKKKGCELTKWTIKNKKLDASLKCNNDDLEAEGRIQGTVSTKSYDLRGEAQGTYKMIPSFANLKLTGQWVKNCVR